MLTTSAPLVSQGDPVALAIVLVLAAVIFVMVLRKRMSKRSPASKPTVPVPVQAPAAPTAPGSAGRLKLHNVPPKTAAMLMAIVADKLGKPLNELRFISIKEVADNEV